MGNTRGSIEAVILRPGSDPEKTLAAALRGSCDAAGPKWIIVDQFEEIFTHCESQAARQGFVRRLWQLSCDSDSQIIVIATLRVDFIGRCGEIALDDAGRTLDAVAYDEAHRVFVSQLSQSSLHAAIEQPARLCGLVLEEGLAQRMIEDVSGEPGALPLLQDTLDILWQRRSGSTLTQSAYDEVGGVAGALHRRADTLISGLSSDEQRVARRLLVRLVNVADDITLSTRRRLPIARLVPRAQAEVAPFERVLSQLTGARLLVRDGEGAAQLVDGEGGPTPYPVQRRGAAGALLRLEGDYLLATRNRRAELAAKRNDFSNNGPFIDGRTVELWGKTLRRTVLFERGAAIRATTLCADQRRVATVTRTGHVTIWRLGKTPRELGLYVLPLSNVKDARVTSDGKKLVLGSADGTVQVWNSDGSELLQLLHESAPISELTISPDDKKLLILHADKSAVLRNIDGTGTPFGYFGSYLNLLPTSFSADGTRVAIVDENHQVVVLQAETGQVLRSFPALIGNRIHGVALRPDGKQLAWTAPRRPLAAGNIDGSVQPQGPMNVGGEELAYSPDGSQLVVGFSEARTRTFDTALNGPLTAYNLANFHGTIALSPDGKRFALAGADSLVLGNTDGSGPRIRHHVDFIKHRGQLVWSGDGKRLLALKGNTVFAWNTDGNQPAMTLHIDDRSVQIATLSKDGKLAVFVGDRGIPWIFDLERVDTLRPEQLRRRIWELGLGCRIDGRVEEFLNRSDHAKTWDLLICHDMQRCVLNALQRSGANYDRCFAEFRKQQNSWLREFQFQTWFHGKVDLSRDE